MRWIIQQLVLVSAISKKWRLVSHLSVCRNGSYSSWLACELCTCFISNLVVWVRMSVCNVCLEDNQQFLISHGQATWHPIKGTSLWICKQTLFYGVTQSARKCLCCIHNKQPNGFFTFLAGFFFSSIGLSKLMGLITINPVLTSSGFCFFPKIK